MKKRRVENEEEEIGSSVSTELTDSIADEKVGVESLKFPPGEFLASLENARSEKAADQLLSIPQTIREILNLPGCLSAKALIGCHLVRNIIEGDDDHHHVERMHGRIVETEYYSVWDKASHSYRGRKTKRNLPMFAGVGRSYVYKIYGVHHCYNVTGGEPGSAILIRAIEPVSGPFVGSTIGPGNLTKTLKITTDLNELSCLDISSAINLQIDALNPTTPTDLTDYNPPSVSVDESSAGEEIMKDLPWQKGLNISASCRIGISKDPDRLWRFYATGSKFVSKHRRQRGCEE